MKIFKEQSLSDFEFWSGAKAHAGILSNSQFEEIERVFEEVYPEGVDETTINDIFWFEPNVIAEYLGYDSWEELEEANGKEETN